MKVTDMWNNVWAVRETMGGLTFHPEILAQRKDRQPTRIKYTGRGQRIIKENSTGPVYTNSDILCGIIFATITGDFRGMNRI